MLSETEKIKITKTLKKINRFLWKDELIKEVFDLIEKVRSDHIDKSDYFVPFLLKYEDYFYELNLIEFI